MKYFCTILLFMSSLACWAHDDENYLEIDMLKSMEPGDKAAILMVYFGTTYDDTKAVTIDSLTRRVKRTFKDLEVREAFTSRIVIRLLKDRGIEMQTPTDALKKLKADGYTHVIVQSTNLIEGVEMTALRREVREMENEFKDIRCSDPMLSVPYDYSSTIRALAPRNIENRVPSDTAILWVGHGTHTSATAHYAMLDHMLKARGYKNYYVLALEGYPSLRGVLPQLENSGIKNIVLRPFMFVAGDHAKNDIATDMKKTLESNGYKVEVLMQGLGEVTRIQNIFISYIRFYLEHKALDIMVKKKAYERPDHVYGRKSNNN